MSAATVETFGPTCYTVEYFPIRDSWLVMEPGGWDIAECRSEEEAQHIADALNAYHGRTAQAQSEEV